MDVQRKGGYANMSGSEIEEQQEKIQQHEKSAEMDAQMERNRRRAEKQGGTSGSTFLNPQCQEMVHQVQMKVHIVAQHPTNNRL